MKKVLIIVSLLSNLIYSKIVTVPIVMGDIVSLIQYEEITIPCIDNHMISEEAYYTWIMDGTATDCEYMIPYDTELDNDNMYTCGAVLKCEEVKDGFVFSQDTWDEDNYVGVVQSLEIDRRGYMNLLAISLTGHDVDNRAGILFSQLMKAYGKEVPIITNGIETRLTPSFNKYFNSSFPHDGILDTNRPGVDELADIIASYPGRVKYLVGGHINIFAELLERYPQLVEEKISDLIISSGWAVTYYRGETNLSSSAEARRVTEFVFNHLPYSVKMTMIDMRDIEGDYTIWNHEILDHNNPLYYMITHGVYFHDKGDKATTGDYDVLWYAVHGCVTNCTEREITIEHDDGMVRVGAPSDKNHNLVEELNGTLFLESFEDLVRGK